MNRGRILPTMLLNLMPGGFEPNGKFIKEPFRVKPTPDILAFVDEKKEPGSPGSQRSIFQRATTYLFGE